MQTAYHTKYLSVSVCGVFPCDIVSSWGAAMILPRRGWRREQAELPGPPVVWGWEAGLSGVRGNGWGSGRSTIGGFAGHGAAHEPPGHWGEPVDCRGQPRLWQQRPHGQLLPMKPRGTVANELPLSPWAWWTNIKGPEVSWSGYGNTPSPTNSIQYLCYAENQSFLSREMLVDSKRQQCPSCHGINTDGKSDKEKMFCICPTVFSCQINLGDTKTRPAWGPGAHWEK